MSYFFVLSRGKSQAITIIIAVTISTTRLPASMSGNGPVLSLGVAVAEGIAEEGLVVAVCEVEEGENDFGEVEGAED